MHVSNTISLLYSKHLISHLQLIISLCVRWMQM